MRTGECSHWWSSPPRGQAEDGQLQTVGWRRRPMAGAGKGPTGGARRRGTWLGDTGVDRNWPDRDVGDPKASSAEDTPGAPNGTLLKPRRTQGNSAGQGDDDWRATSAVCGTFARP